MKITKKLKRNLAASFAIHDKPVSLSLKTIKGHVFVDAGANHSYYFAILRGNFEDWSVSRDCSTRWLDCAFRGSETIKKLCAEFPI